MKRYARAIVLALLLCCLTLGAWAEAGGAERFYGTWNAGDITVNVRPKGEDIQLYAVHNIAVDRRDLLEYDVCWYDEETGTVQCLSVCRSSEVYDILTGEWKEIDWSLNDMHYGQLELSEDGVLIWTDDALKAPLKLTKLV